MAASSGARHRVVEIFEPSRGGVPTHVAQLGAGLIARGWRVTVAGPEDAPAMDQLGAAGADLVRLKIAHHPHPRDVATIRALLKACGDDASIIHGHSTKAGLLAAWTSRLSGIPSVYTPHSWAFDRALSVSARAAYAVYERRTSRAHRLIIAVAESERQQGLRYRIKAQSAIQVVYNGIPANPTEIDRDFARASLEIAEAGFVACWVGRYAPQKRPQDLPALALELNRAGISLVALGDGLAASPEASRIVSAGGVVLADGSDPQLLYAAADALVSTSAWEGHPIAILEAMRAGLPVAAYAVGGIPEQVEESRTGYLVPPGSIEELAGRVALLAESDSLRQRMGAAARARQSETFGLATMLDRVEEIYSQVMASVVKRPSSTNGKI